MHTDSKVRWLAGDEIQSGKAVLTEHSRRLYRMRLKKEDFLEHGFKEMLSRLPGDHRWHGSQSSQRDVQEQDAKCCGHHH